MIMKIQCMFDTKRPPWLIIKLSGRREKLKKLYRSLTVHFKETTKLDSIEEQKDNSTLKEDDNNNKSFLPTTTSLPIYYRQ